MECLNTITWMLLNLHPNMSMDKVNKFAEPICKYSKLRDIDPVIVLAVQQHENPRLKVRYSYHNKNKTSDIGVMQFNCPHFIPRKNWRYKWCTRKGIRRLKTINGGIKAGVEELFWKRKICLNSKKHKSGFSNNHYKYIIYYDYNTLTVLGKSFNKIFYSDYFINTNYYHIHCNDCFYNLDYNLILNYQKIFFSSFSKNYSLIMYSNIQKPSFHTKRKHWWLKHYNYNAPGGYDLKIRFIYKALKKNEYIYYKAIKNRLHIKLAKKNKLRRCILKKNLCIGELHGSYKRRTHKKNKKRKSITQGNKTKTR